jgi:cysteinyl-tRNA synthetase
MHHYRSPLDFSLEDVFAAGKSYKRLVAFFKDVSSDNCSAHTVQEDEFIQSCMHYLNDDFNTAAIIGKIFEYLNQEHADTKSNGPLKWFIQNVLGLTLTPLQEKTTTITPEIQALIDERIRAREQKNWSRADELRDQLQKFGIEVQDKKM